MAVPVFFETCGSDRLEVEFKMNMDSRIQFESGCLFFGHIKNNEEVKSYGKNHRYSS